MELRKPRKQQRTLPATGHNSLMLACQQEAKEEVRNILDRQPGIAIQRDPSGKHALHYCVENSTVECASRVLSASPSLLNVPDDEGYTPLHLAVISGNKAIAKYLLTRGADPSAVDSEKHSCVHWATVTGDCECLNMLINAGADPSTPDIHGAYPVHYAAQMCGPNSEMGNDIRAGLAVLRTLLTRGVDVACVDRDGRPPLLWAASGETRASKTYCPSGSSDAILALVKAGADVNAVDRDGLTALHCAASRGHVDCLETLTSLCGAEVDKADDGGCSALFYAVTLGHADCTNLLLNYGSDPNIQDKRGRSPAHCGAAKGQMETLKILSTHKANLWLRNAKGDMPLHEAVQSGRKDLVEWFLQNHRASVNATNGNGRTPLHIAAITNNVDMCKILMDYGAFVNPVMRNSKGQHLTPMDAALYRSNRSCAKYLSLHGALPASKMMEKRDQNRFSENEQPDKFKVSPNTQRRTLCDSSAQTELRSRDVDIQTKVDLKSVAATTSDLEQQKISRSRMSCDAGATAERFRCPAEDAKGKPIIARVYVHTKRQKGRRSTRKSTAFRRDCQGEKLVTGQQHKVPDDIQSTANRASNSIADTVISSQSNEIPGRKASQPILYEERQTALFEEEQKNSELYEEQHTEDHQEILPEERQPLFQDEDERDFSESARVISETEVVSSQLREDESQSCMCYETHENGSVTCSCNCHEFRERTEQLSIEKRRESSMMTPNDVENQSPLSSIRSYESNVKDSGFSDEIERSHREELTSSDGGNDLSDSESNSLRRRKRHIARYIVSSGAAEDFRLDEDDEEDETKVVVKPRSSSLPHLKKREDKFETCPRLLNRPTITKEVQRSLKKYQMERRLFYELQELKRKQITAAPGEERETVIKMVERFRNYVLGPTMTDFQGPHTFASFEKYLYEQLRKLSMGGKIPKPKASTKNRVYTTPLPLKNSKDSHILCTCQTHKCHHRLRKSDSDLTLPRTDNSEIPTLPEIITKTQVSKERPSRIPVNRSKSWDRLENSPRKNSTLPTRLGNVQSNSLPSLSNPFPRRVPAALLAAISEKLGPDVHPDDMIVVEMSSDNVSSKMRHAFSVQELKEVVTRYEEHILTNMRAGRTKFKGGHSVGQNVIRYEEQVGRKVKPIHLETVMDPDDDGPITFEIRHGKERNVFRLPAGKLKDNKKWFLHYCLWPVGRYMLSPREDQLGIPDPEDIKWEEIQLSPRTVLMLPPNFWT